MAIAAPVGVLIGTGPAVEPAPGDDERTPREAPTAPLRPSQATPHHPIRIATPAHRASASSEARLEKRIRELVRASGLAAPRGKGAVAVSVRACDDGAGPGRELVAIDADRPLKPASNMKVATSFISLSPATRITR